MKSVRAKICNAASNYYLHSTNNKKMKNLFFLIVLLNVSVCYAQNGDKTILIGQWRVCKSDAPPMVFIFIDSINGEKGLLKNWNAPTDYLYKTPLTYKISEAPKENLTGKPAFDEMLFWLTITSKTLSNKIDTQSFLVHIANKDSIGFVLRPGFITPLCRVK